MTRQGPELKRSVRPSIVADWSPLRLDRGFRTLWLGQVGSAVGRETARIAIPLHVYLLTESAAMLGVVAMAQLVAGVALSFVGGALADTHDRRRVMMGAQLAMGIASAALAVTGLMPNPPVLMLVALAFVLAALHPIEHPARVASVARLVPGHRLTSAIALTSLNFQASSVIGPAVAGLLIGLSGVTGAYALMALGYGWSLFTTARMPSLRPSDQRAASRLALIADGLKFVRQRRIILSTFAIDLNAMIFGLPIALFPVLAIDVFQAGAAEVGFLAAARGAGAFSAALFSGWIPRVTRLGQAVLVAVLVFSASTLVLGYAGLPLAVALLLIAICGAADLASAVMRNAVVQTVTPDQLRGRVTALHGLATNAGPRIGDVRAALMAEFLGASAAISIGGVLALAGVAVVHRFFPQLAAYRAPVPEQVGSSAESTKSRGRSM